MCPETTVNSPEWLGVSPGEVRGPEGSSSRRSRRTSLTVSRIIARKLVGFIATSSVAVLAHLGEDGSICSPSAMSRDVVDERVGRKGDGKRTKTGGAVAGSCPEL